MTRILDNLNIKEKTKLLIFQKKHKKCYAGAMGGGMSYILTPTGLGMLVEVRCNICNKEISLTNLENA